MKRLIAGLVTAIVVALLSAVGTAPAEAVNIGKEGCTPGFWKNHTDVWEEADPADLFSDAFSAGTSGVLDGLTLEEALGGGGGSGLAGAELILARAATAAYLNAAH